MTTRSILVGAVSGFVAAALVDLHAWSDGAGAFEWGLALKRWITGAISGAVTAAGLTEVA